MLDPQPEADKVEPVAAEPEEQAPAEDAQANPEAEEQPQDDDPTVTVKVDGKDVEVKLSELKGSYQKDKAAAQRFEQAAELRKQADAETAKARQERQTYAQNLQAIAMQAHAALQQQQKIDWDALKQSDPVEFVNQVRLAQERQAVLARSSAELQQIAALEQAEHQRQLEAHLTEQSKELVSLIPDWADEAKAKAGKAAVRDYLASRGYDERAISGLTDAKTVALANKARLYDEMVAKASAAAKKVQTLPTKVERSGTGHNPGLDRRSSAFQSLSKSGKVEDAARVFAGLL